jgi:hypothetical protein
MILSSIKRVVLIADTVDFRKQFNGLLAESYRRNYNPYDGDCLVFFKRDSTQIRLLVGDCRGLYLLARRFDGGRLRVSHLFKREESTITSGELSLLLEGATFTVAKRVKEWSPKIPGH